MGIFLLFGFYNQESLQRDTAPGWDKPNHGDSSPDLQAIKFQLQKEVCPGTELWETKTIRDNIKNAIGLN